MTLTERPKRSYNSARRRAQAGETRKQVLEAARALFAELGYTGATMDAIAQRAGVATETVFAIFGNKRSILASLIELAVGGDEQPIPLLERPGPRAVLEQSDPALLLQAFADDITTILTRVAPLFEIMRMAAKTEPEIAVLLERVLEERLRNLAAIPRQLSARGALRAGLDETEAAEVLWAISSPELFRLLTVDRGWDTKRYVRWLGESLARLLLS